MKHYIIDGNNLIGKDKSLNQIQKKNKQQSREKLALLLGRYFSKRKASVSLHFDGFESDLIKVPGVKIIYSGSVTADEKIKIEIDRSKNPKNNILVTSDSNLSEFGRVCSCQIIKSEEFIRNFSQMNNHKEEDIKSNPVKNIEEYKRLFGIDS
ncbi:MAG: hypothetical protein H6Q27_868 [Ignavibacteriaceae bacterium]|nr:hypothetical protein [Ignavibacteriaceae bacterium]